MLDAYVCDGVESDVAVVVLPSPQSTVYLFGLPTAEIVRVVLSPAPPVVTLAVKSTPFTNVLFCTFSNASFKSSTAFATVVAVTDFWQKI